MNKDKMVDYIETDRLVLFPYTKDNLALFNRNLPLFEKTFDVIYHGEELDYLLKEFLLKLEKEIADDPDNYLFFTEFLIVLKENNHIIGSIDYKYIPIDGVTEVGYGMNPKYTGNGYMSEALKVFLSFGRKMGIKVVRADTKVDNIKSQNVLKRCGFHYLKQDINIWWEKRLDDMNKIIIIGPSGAGKSTFSRRLKEKLNLPLYHLDNIWWNKDKTHVTTEEFDERLAKILKEPKWIIDGNYKRTHVVRMEACDTIILLDYPLDVCLQGANDRIGKERDDIPWTEDTLDPEFKEWIIYSVEEDMPETRRLVDSYKDKKQVIIFHSREESEEYLNSL